MTVWHCIGWNQSLLMVSLPATGFTIWLRRWRMFKLWRIPQKRLFTCWRISVSYAFTWIERCHNQILSFLEPYTKYTIWVKAFTSKHEGNSSATIEVLTDVSGPGRSLITNLTCPGDNTLYVEWTQPEKHYHSVDKYLLYFRSREEKAWQQRIVLVSPVAKHNVEKVRSLHANCAVKFAAQNLDMCFEKLPLHVPDALD